MPLPSQFQWSLKLPIGTQHGWEISVDARTHTQTETHTHASILYIRMTEVLWKCKGLEWQCFSMASFKKFSNLSFSLSYLISASFLVNCCICRVSKVKFNMFNKPRTHCSYLIFSGDLISPPHPIVVSHYGIATKSSRNSKLELVV